MAESQNSHTSTEPTEDLNHVMRARLEKLDKLRRLGVIPYPYSYEKSHSIADTLSEFTQLERDETSIRIAGRIMSLRLMGKAAFAHLQDEGRRLQIYFKKNIIGDDRWELFRLLDIGDIIGVEGSLFVTRTGERTLQVKALSLLSKNIRPLPAIKETEEKIYYSWSDKENRYRQRSIDLLINQDSRETLVTRSLIVGEIRRYLGEMGFLEVETPILQPIYGGAAARPFTTYYQALDYDFYLRIADELYLKRLIAGGIDRVFEIAKDFRNEGIDRMHAPEFTMMECYAAYEDYNFCTGLTEGLLRSVAERVFGYTTFSFGYNEFDLDAQFKRFTMRELVQHHCGIDIVNRGLEELRSEVKSMDIDVEPSWGAGKIIDELFSEKVEPQLVEPTFVFDYPIELSPLAKKHRDTPGLVERFELYVAGMEIANAFSELNDPVDQRQRFEEQSRLRSLGDEETHPIDEDYLEALETGLPPTAGLGIGVDRLVMLFTGRVNIRDVITFPALRPKT